MNVKNKPKPNKSFNSQIQVISKTCFGIVILSYSSYSIDGEAPEEVVLARNDAGVALGVIYNTRLQDVTAELIEKTCNYDHTIK